MVVHASTFWEAEAGRFVLQSQASLCRECQNSQNIDPLSNNHNNYVKIMQTSQ